ncbi:cupin domain-containing protein [Luteibacter yeojuensis]|uniref:JmjC domain-containing protein n=1 Tax=Luteibacter yeojuensis TaxID=345309 RepID=A0A7X5QRU0_9GAMM|nr:cupin domain-containing protein [Luteibacter yeojuensis]NID14215.1 hypothetical protein [Luteibacter yeojuensis]
MDLGISSENFTRDYYGKSPFLFRGSLKSHTNDWKLFDGLIFASEMEIDSIGLFLHGSVPQSAYVESFHDVGRLRRRLIVPAVEDLLRRGASLVINHADSKSRPIDAISKFLGNFVGERTAANAYVAFGGEGAFGKHWDTHDVFAVQLIGRKRWLVYSPTFPMPLAVQNSRNRKHECPLDPVMDVVLAAGDVLYLPRGWWHHAIPIEGEESAHVAVGIHPAHMIDYVIWCCINVMPNEPIFRESLEGARIRSELAERLGQSAFEVLSSSENIVNFEKWFKSIHRNRDECNLGCIRNEAGIMNENSAIVLNTVFDPVWVEGETTINGVRLRADAISSEFINRLTRGDAGNMGAILSNLSSGDRAKASELLRDLLRERVCYFRERDL